MARGKTNENEKSQKKTDRKQNKKQPNKNAAVAAAEKNAAAKTKASEVTDVSVDVKDAAASFKKASKKRKNLRLAKWEEKESLILLEGWARKGLTMEQIAHNMGISKQTLYRWQEESCYICDAIKKGKEVTDFLVENALFLSALSGNVVAQIFWLKNRMPESWKDKVEQVIDTEADTAGIVLLAPVLEKNHEPTEESDMGATTQAD